MEDLFVTLLITVAVCLFVTFILLKSFIKLVSMSSCDIFGHSWHYDGVNQIGPVRKCSCCGAKEVQLSDDNWEPVGD